MWEEWLVRSGRWNKEIIDKHFDAHNHVGHYVISVVMQGTVTVCLENREESCCRGDVFIIPPYAIHSVCQGRDARLLSMCVGTALIEKIDLETAEGIVQELLMDAGIKILADKITSHPKLKLPIETLVADIFVSKYYFIRKFKSSIGMIPHQFCIQNRIRKSHGKWGS